MNGGAGARFRAAVERDRPLPVLGAVSAYMARLAEHAGAKALYLSGGGVAAFSCGIPDLGITTAEDVLTDLRRITAVTALPVLVDIDTGWGSSLNIARTVRGMEGAGAAGAHIEDQVQAKRCGHRPGKAIVVTQEMVDRLKAAVDVRTDRAPSSSPGRTPSPAKGSTRRSDAQASTSRNDELAGGRRIPADRCAGLAPHPNDAVVVLLRCRASPRTEIAQSGRLGA